ncbi:cytochrome c oxidase subunit 4 isoform 1, mitochondrial-like isoform X1 [Patiria miniata]|uniref:Cytochrome c oxidase subunit 4 n=2 Tax=Patiria miniata TaxID=46514 RepID=A0A913YYN5_PATMI|nr:cytochrome c oxidase subunit 4 isoform 1, mitochondrial-like isoform X1 [Patiria miniata]
MIDHASRTPFPYEHRDFTGNCEGSVMAVNMLRVTSRRFVASACQRSSSTLAYADRLDYPAPPCRFVDDVDLSADMQSLKAKEQGDWKSLSVDEKRALYRLSFDKSYSEMRAPTGEWKYIIGGVFGLLSVAIFFYGLQKKFIAPPLPITMTKEWQQDQMKYNIAIRNNPVTGLASKWDYEKNDWKK